MRNQGRAEVPSSGRHVVNVSRFSSRKQTQVTACKVKVSVWKGYCKENTWDRETIDTGDFSSEHWSS